MSGELSGYTLPVHSLESFGVHDGPGIRFIIFTQGCGFRCAYCHNPDTISAEGGHQTELEEIARLIMNSKAYFGNKGGVTVSGGEPLIHAGKLIPLFRFLKKEGINTALDTTGNFMNADVEELLGLTDLVLLDVKHIDPAKHKLLTGVSNANTLAFAEKLREINKNTWLRYVLVPGWTDAEKDLDDWGRHFSGYGNISRVEILPYHRLGVHKWEKLGMDYRLKDVPVPDKETLAKAGKIFSRYFSNVIIK